MTRKLFIIISVLTAFSFNAKAGSDTLLLHTELPYLNDDNKVIEEVYYKSDTAFNGTLQLFCYKYNSDKDSILVLRKANYKTRFKPGVNTIKLNLSQNDNNTFCFPKFFEVLKRVNIVAPGKYKVYLNLTGINKPLNKIFYYSADSALPPNSAVRNKINKTLLPKQKSFLGFVMSSSVASHGVSAGNAILNAGNKLGRAFKSAGLTPVSYQRNGKSYIDLYYQDWFAGRYEMKRDQSLSKQIDEQKSQFNGSIGSFTSNDLDNYPSMFSQFRTLTKDKKDDQSVIGEISLESNVSNGQEEYSGMDDNYYQLSGHLEMPIMGMPMDLDGLYTSQDNHRLIKSSFIRVHYDADKAKGEMQQMISAYDSKYAETKAKGAGMAQIYQASITNLESQKSSLQAEINNELSSSTGGVNNLNAGNLKQLAANDLKNAEQDTALLRQRLMSTADTTAAAKDISEKDKEINDQVAEKKAKLIEKEKKLEALEAKIEKYQALLAQYNNTNYFDSTLGYNKLKGINGQSETTYKQMAQSAENILPAGKAKSFLTGITSFDAGMFSQYESNYTMSGQMLKGLSLGYDLGLFTTTVTAGKTQYIGRDGNVDNYNCYAVKAALKPIKKQKISILYYEYSPTRNLLTQDNFFKNMDISAPDFFQPVNIVSLDYDGIISKYVTINSEVATSIYKTDKTVPDSIYSSDKMAYHFSVDANIPKTMISLQGSYDKTGKGFLNSTLPVTMSGTECYSIQAKDDILKSLLTLGIEYDYLMQDNFGEAGGNSRWGFDARTNWRKYPNLSVSYKPFTTFRSYTDTLNVPQRPLVGSVATGQSSYQIRKKGRSLRFSFMYNKSTSELDTVKYGTTIAQLSCIYSDKVWNVSVSGGEMKVSGTDSATIAAANTMPSNTVFGDFSVNYLITKTFSVSGGQDVGFAPFGFCKYGAQAGVRYRLQKLPITTTVDLRCTTYELAEGEAWSHLYSGNIDVTWDIHAKLSRK